VGANNKNAIDYIINFASVLGVTGFFGYVIRRIFSTLAKGLTPPGSDPTGEIRERHLRIATRLSELVTLGIFIYGLFWYFS
jgi:hypothetical protein